MQEKRYMNRELDTKFEALHQKLIDQDGVLAKILEQTTKTNGRVTWLEKVLYSGLVGVAVFMALQFPSILAIILKLL